MLLSRCRCACRRAAVDSQTSDFSTLQFHVLHRRQFSEFQFLLANLLQRMMAFVLLLLFFRLVLQMLLPLQ